MTDQATGKPFQPSRKAISYFLFGLVALGVIARLYRIDIPLFDWHVFRQFDTAALARNFYDGRMNILYPQVDWRGGSPGYVEAEFQIYTYLVALVYQVLVQ